MIEKMLKNLSNAVLCFIGVAIVAVSCTDTALAQNGQFLVGGTNVAAVSFCATTGVGLENQATSINLSTSDGFISTWSTTLNANWFKVTPASGNTTPQLLTVSTTPGADSLPQGVSSGTITINPGVGSSETAATISVTANVNSSGCGSSSGNLILSSPSLLFSIPSNIQQQSVNFTVTNNTGTTITLNGTATSGSGFLALTPLASTTIPSGQSLNYQVTANTTGLTSGFTYTGNLNFTTSSGNATATVPVTLNFGTSGTGGLIPDQTSLTFNFGASSSVQSSSLTLNVKNNTTSTVTINGSITFGAFLLLQGSAQQVGPGNSASFQVTGSTSGLVSGNTYSGSLSFTDNVGDTLSVPVTLNYNTGTTNNGPISSTQSSFPFTAALGSGPQFTSWFIANNSSAAIVLNASSTTSTGQNWLSVTPSSQTLAAGGTIGVTITVDPTVLNNVSGTYTGTATVNANSTSVSAQSLLGTLSVPVTLVLGTGGTAVVTVNPASFSASIALNGGTNIQNLNVTNNSTSSITLSMSASGSGLSVSPSGQTTIAAGNTSVFTVTFNPSGLVAGNYAGSITITPVIGAFSTITIPTTLCYGTSGTCQAASTSITATPNPIGITVPAGSTQVQNQPLTVTSSVGAVTVQAFASTSTGAQWLTVTPSSAAFSSNTTFQVSVSPQFLPSSGVGTGTITLIPSIGTQLSIPVNVNTGSGALTITPSQLSFAYQTGTSNPPAQSLTISSASSIGFTIAATASGGNWLIVSPLSGATAGNGAGSTVSVSVNPSTLGLQPGTYNGQIVVTNSSTLTTQTIPVTLLVSTLPILSFNNSGTTFNFQFGSATFPTQQTVQITSSGVPLSFSANANAVSGGNFLTVTPSNGSTPQTLTLSLNPSAVAVLAPGTYTSNVSVLSNGAGNSPVTYPVTLNVTNNTVLNASQSSLNFNYQIGQAQPGTQIVNISSSGQPLTFTVTPASTNCGNFLTATSANTTTPGQVAVGVNINGLAAGTCTGTVSISSASAGNSPLIIPVNLIVSNSALLNVSPAAINVTTQVSTNPQSQIIALTSTDPNNQLTFSVNTAPNSSFLTVGPTTGNTPNNVNVGFVTSGLAVGTYTSNLTITATGPSNSTVANSPVTVPITVVVTSTTTASTTPSSLTFNQAFSGSAPPNQTLQVNSTTNGLTYSATASTLNGGNNWLSVSSPTGVTPGTVTVSANGSSLGTGTYTGFVTIVIPGAANSPIQVQVTLNVGPAQTLMLGSSNLSFTFASGATTPQPQTVALSSTGGITAFTATTSGAPLFVAVTPTSGNTPTSLSVSLNATALATLAAGTYTNQVVISSPGLASVTITVALTVQATPAPTISTILNGASLQPGAVSPGEVVTILGANLGPATGVLFSVGADGKMSTNISGTTVTFDGILAPLIFVRTDQINAIVPYEIGGRLNTNIVVTRNSQSSAALQQKVVETSPAIFSLSQTGNGQGAILNSNSTVNSTSNPATRGTAIQIFATGEGALVPGTATGSFTPSSPPFPKPIANVSVTIGGAPATVTYMGEAPGLVSGVLQVNAIVPQSVGAGPQTVVLTVGANQNITQVVTVQVQ